MSHTQFNKPKYRQNVSDRQHFRELKERVHSCVDQISKKRVHRSWFKIILLPGAYVTAYLLAVQQDSDEWGFYLLYALMGLIAVSIFLNLIHEAAHENIFRSHLLNRFVFYLFDLIGGNSYIWGKRHISLHHNFPNVSGWDSDIEQSGPIKIFPNGVPHSFQRFQHRFFIFLYPLYLLNWVIIRDFKDFFNRDQIVRKITEISPKEYLILFAGKLFFIGYTVIIPWQFFEYTLTQSISGLIIMLISGGILGLTVLLTPHVNDGNEYPLTSSSNTLESSWFMHQLLTTNDVEVNNVFTRYFMGNFNYHLAHHLFPNISYVYAPEVTKVIREYAEANQLPYRSYPFWEALKRHYNLLKSNAMAEMAQQGET